MGILGRLNTYFSCKDAFTEVEWHNHRCHKKGDLEDLIIDEKTVSNEGNILFKQGDNPRFPGRWKVR